MFVIFKNKFVSLYRKTRKKLFGFFTFWHDFCKQYIERMDFYLTCK